MSNQAQKRKNLVDHLWKAHLASMENNGLIQEVCTPKEIFTIGTMVGMMYMQSMLSSDIYASPGISNKIFGSIEEVMEYLKDNRVGCPCG